MAKDVYKERIKNNLCVSVRDAHTGGYWEWCDLPLGHKGKHRIKFEWQEDIYSMFGGILPGVISIKGHEETSGYLFTPQQLRMIKRCLKKSA